MFQNKVAAMTSKNSIKFKYIFEDNYNPEYINGAYGGITPKGEIVINFFFERHGLPKSETISLTDGQLGSEIEREPVDHKQSMVRVVKNGIILSLKNAKTINDFLSDYIKKLEELNKIKEKAANELNSKNK
jgi:hypothetical protein